MGDKHLRIGIVAGESSGDILASGLIKQIQLRYPDAHFVGIGGPKMLALGCQSLFNMEELSVMGLVEVLSRIRRLLFVRKSLLNYFLANPVDVFIGVDAPDFNLALELKLKRQGTLTVHYVSPTVWAWREKRVFNIAKATHLVLSIFPFEKAIYDKYAIPCEFIGHTLADEIPLEPDKAAARKSLNLKPNDTVLAVLPGSRQSEVAALLDVFMQSSEILAKAKPELKVLIPVVNRQRKNQVEAYFANRSVFVDYRIVIGHSRLVMIASDAVLLASGTATLEAMLCKRPMVAAYQLNKITHLMMKWLYKAKYFSLPNILADEKIVPELLQEEVNANTISDLLLPMLTDDSVQEKLNTKFTELHLLLKKNADVKAADAVLKLIEAS